MNIHIKEFCEARIEEAPEYQEILSALDELDRLQLPWIPVKGYPSHSIPDDGELCLLLREWSGRIELEVTRYNSGLGNFESGASFDQLEIIAWRSVKTILPSHIEVL